MGTNINRDATNLATKINTLLTNIKKLVRMRPGMWITGTAFTFANDSGIVCTIRLLQAGFQA